MHYDGGTEFTAKSILDNQGLVLLYFAVLILLVFMMVWHLKVLVSKTSSEHYYGYGMPDTIQFAAGAPNIRFQEFTGTNQGSTPVNMATIKQMYPGVLPKERLTSMRESPVFYDISSTLDAYQQGTRYSCADGIPAMPVKDAYGNMTYACGDGSQPTSGGQTGLDSTAEHAEASPATAVQEALLMRQLGY